MGGTRAAVSSPAAYKDVREQFPRTFKGRRLTSILAVGDFVAIGIAFGLVATIATSISGEATALSMVPPLPAVLGLLAIRSQRLWDPARLTIRSSEMAGAAKAAALTGAGVVLTDRLLAQLTPVALVAAASATTWALLIVWRSTYRSWLATARRAGRHVQPTIVVGTGREAMEIVRLAEIHPEAGSVVIGIVGSRAETEAAGRGRLWLGEIDDLSGAVEAYPAARIAICSADVAPATVAGLVRARRSGGAEVIIHAGVSSVAARRVTVSAFAHEAVLHVAPATPSPAALAVKRLLDIVIACAILFVASPVLAVIAVLVKREDGGPVLFRQQRVGRGDAEFGMLKFRTMVVDAEARLRAMEGDNQRIGPLFKMARDPRVTRIGNLLRRTSLDELPQLINVLRGDMSLVGPRPALRTEVADFPADLHGRHDVRPGITGLWQVEARDTPAFDAYHRLDLHYVENWTLALDLVILMATVEHLVMRPLESRRRGELTTEPAMVPLAAAAAHAEAPALVVA
jgi:exopolysaccharide biosynthesis polyprenyl glycosylphosphotransferase